MMRMVWAVDGFEGGLVGYSLLMCEMLCHKLWEPIIATDWEEQSETAV